MFALLAMTMLDDVNTINTWAEPHNATGGTVNHVLGGDHLHNPYGSDSEDVVPMTNQKRWIVRGY